MTKKEREAIYNSLNYIANSLAGIAHYESLCQLDKELAIALKIKPVKKKKK